MNVSIYGMINRYVSSSISDSLEGIIDMIDNNKLKEKNIHFHTFVRFLIEIKNLIVYGSVGPSHLYIINKEKKLIYITNEKVACSSIKAAMANSEGSDDNSVHAQMFKENRAKHKLTPEEKDYYVFTIVRNPYDRLVSCYESKYHKDRTKFGKKRLTFDAYLLGYIRKDQGFDTFLRKICKLPGPLMNRHFLMQYDKVYDRKGKTFTDFVGKFENIGEDYEVVRSQFDLMPLKHFNNSGSNERNWMDYYTLETAELVHKKYAKDFEVFGYEDEYVKLVDYLKNKNQ